MAMESFNVLGLDVTHVRKSFSAPSGIRLDVTRTASRAAEIELLVSEASNVYVASNLPSGVYFTSKGVPRHPNLKQESLGHSKILQECPLYTKKKCWVSTIPR